MRKRPRAASAMARMFCHCSSLLRLRLRSECDDDADTSRLTSVAPKPASRSASARCTAWPLAQVALYITPSRRGSARSSSVASANCGTTFGFEYDVASTRGKPTAAKRSTSATFVSVGTKAGSCCSPSRAKHSHRTTSAVMDVSGTGLIGPTSGTARWHARAACSSGPCRWRSCRFARSRSRYRRTVASESSPCAAWPRPAALRRRASCQA